MSRLEILSSEVVQVLAEFGFQVHSQKGSHVKLRRVGGAGNQTLTVPNHRQLDVGNVQSNF